MVRENEGDLLRNNSEQPTRVGWRVRDWGRRIERGLLRLSPLSTGVGPEDIDEALKTAARVGICLLPLAPIIGMERMMKKIKGDRYKLGDGTKLVVGKATEMIEDQIEEWKDKKKRKRK